MAAAKPKKPKFKNLPPGKLPSDAATRVTVEVEPGQGSNKAGGVVHVFHRVGKLAFQRMVRIEDATANGDRIVSIKPPRGRVHSMRVIMWDRKVGERPTFDSINTDAKLQFQVQ